ncbi:pyrroloquinoline quinone biosynthesis protein PqqB [Saccharopolyspora sp. K220]|uniref:pyrroloquinoline quinone biosynthesis protein PqqB n=1 Tax=Saccharopolyspora soli TaxID=2926618 RepID=UPI001F5732A1|nr:pyrroloquinoline quinone biosynthesis protein PqqB [Saccharopolyspora soli]MCI2422413.1 pyrroloquinoline quinone biosynthesis protein PqqB [Saccharopolyspora soli]
MRVRVLGTAAGGGLPQWNCGCESCCRAEELGTQRTQDCLAISGDGTTWYLVNASPDLRTQLLAAPELRPPPGTRRTPVEGVLLTSAELDHTLGLVTLREASQLTIYATEGVHRALREAFPITEIIGNYTAVRSEQISNGLVLAGGIAVQVIGVGDKRPRYASGLAGHDWVVAYRFTDTGSGRSLVYAPCLPAWHEAFERIIDGADTVLLDGTFHTEDELTRSSGSDRPASSMGHLPIRAALQEIARHPKSRFLFTHLNNTNPLVHPDAPEHAEVRAAGAAIAAERQLLVLE